MNASRGLFSALVPLSRGDPSGMISGFGVRGQAPSAPHTPFYPCLHHGIHAAFIGLFIDVEPSGCLGTGLRQLSRPPPASHGEWV